MDVALRSVRTALGLPVALPDDLVAVALTDKSGPLSHTRAQSVAQRFSLVPNNTTLSLLGSNVLSLLNVQLLMTGDRAEVGDVSQLNAILIGQHNVACLAHRKNLCDYVVYEVRTSTRTSPRSSPRASPRGEARVSGTTTVGEISDSVCATAFKALVGAVYYYYNTIIHDAYALNKVLLWLDNEWDYSGMVERVRVTRTAECVRTASVDYRRLDVVDGPVPFNRQHRGVSFPTFGEEIEDIQSYVTTNQLRFFRRLVGRTVDGQYVVAAYIYPEGVLNPLPVAMGVDADLPTAIAKLVEDTHDYVLAQTMAKQ